MLFKALIGHDIIISQLIFEHINRLVYHFLELIVGVRKFFFPPSDNLDGSFIVGFRQTIKKIVFRKSPLEREEECLCQACIAPGYNNREYFVFAFIIVMNKLQISYTGYTWDNLKLNNYFDV